MRTVLLFTIIASSQAAPLGEKLDNVMQALDAEDAAVIQYTSGRLTSCADVKLHELCGVAPAKAHCPNACGIARGEDEPVAHTVSAAGKNCGPCPPCASAEKVMVATSLASPITHDAADETVSAYTGGQLASCAAVKAREFCDLKIAREHCASSCGASAADNVASAHHTVSASSGKDCDPCPDCAPSPSVCVPPSPPSSPPLPPVSPAVPLVWPDSTGVAMGSLIFDSKLAELQCPEADAAVLQQTLGIYGYVWAAELYSLDKLDRLNNTVITSAYITSTYAPVHNPCLLQGWVFS